MSSAEWPTGSDPVTRYDALRSKEQDLIACFAAAGVDHVEYVAVPNDPAVGVWLGTRTDAERDALRARSDLVSVVAATLADVPDTVITSVGVESEESVQRDFAGSWFYVLR